MSGRYVQADLTELEDFVKGLHNASARFKDDMALFLDAAGVDMLRIIQDEIIRLEVVDTRLLLKSFHKGDANNIYELSEGGLTLTIATNVEYAAYVNDGHWLNPQRVEKRKQRYINGRHYIEHAVNIMETMFPQLAERRLEAWFSQYFSD